MKKLAFEPSGDLAISPEAVGLTWPRAPKASSIRGGVCVIDVSGPLEHHPSQWFESYASLTDRIEGALCDEKVTSILLKIDSPGGEVSGLQETVRKIRSLRAEHDKPIVAYADDEAYSAAYAIACAADEIYIPESGGVGSVGVLATLCDRTEMTKKEGLRIEVIRSGTRKAEGHPDIPLDDRVIDRVQVRVDSLAKQFFALVADVRPVSRADLEALQGQCLFGKRAVNAGLADGIASFDEVLYAMSDDKVFDTIPGKAITGETMKPFAVLEKKVAEALAAFTAAKTSAAKKTAKAAYASALTALTEAKVRKSYKKKTTEEEEETDDGEAEESDEDSEESDEDSEEDSKKAKADDEDDEDDDDDDSSANMKAAKPVGDMIAYVKSLTGQSSSRAAKQVLASMHEQAQLAASNAEEIAKLKAAASKARVNELVSEGVAAGKIKPSQLAWAKTQSVSQLKAYLEATPAMFAPRAPVMPHTAVEQNGEVDAEGLTATERKICEMTGVSVDSYKKQRALGVPTVRGN